MAAQSKPKRRSTALIVIAVLVGGAMVICGLVCCGLSFAFIKYSNAMQCSSAKDFDECSACCTKADYRISEKMTHGPCMCRN